VFNLSNRINNFITKATDDIADNLNYDEGSFKSNWATPQPIKKPKIYPKTFKKPNEQINLPTPPDKPIMPRIKIRPLPVENKGYTTEEIQAKREERNRLWAEARKKDEQDQYKREKAFDIEGESKRRQESWDKGKNLWGEQLVVPIESKGSKNIVEVLGASPNTIVNAIAGKSKFGMARDYVPNMRDSLNFLDFYTRLSNNAVTDREIKAHTDKLKDNLLNFMEDTGFNTFGLGSKKKVSELKKIYNDLDSNSRLDRVVGLERLVNIAHNVEPTIIPHIFGVKDIDARVELQPYITHALNYLRSPERRELSKSMLLKSIRKMLQKGRGKI
jgi:hypothetical protein